MTTVLAVRGLCGHDAIGDLGGGEFPLEELDHLQCLWLDDHRLLDEHRGVAKGHELLSLLLHGHGLYRPCVRGEDVRGGWFGVVRHDSASVANETGSFGPLGGEIGLPRPLGARMFDSKRRFSDSRWTAFRDPRTDSPGFLDLSQEGAEEDGAERAFAVSATSANRRGGFNA